jgi:uridine kinase
MTKIGSSSLIDAGADCGAVSIVQVSKTHLSHKHAYFVANWDVLIEKMRCHPPHRILRSRDVSFDWLCRAIPFWVGPFNCGDLRLTEREQLLNVVAHHIIRLSPGRIVRVAIDGVDGAGKTTFADELADVIRALPRPVIRASVDGFHNPRALRYRRGRGSPEGYFEDTYNYDAVKKYLLDPLSPGGSRRYRAAVFDHVTDMAVSAPELEACPSSILLFDGIFLHRPELRPYWDASIFLQVDFAVSVARCASRDGSSPDVIAIANRRYVEGQRLYLLACEPAKRATMTIDNNDLSTPVLVTELSEGSPTAR